MKKFCIILLGFTGTIFGAEFLDKEMAPLFQLTKSTTHWIATNAHSNNCIKQLIVTLNINQECPRLTNIPTLKGQSEINILAEDIFTGTIKTLCILNNPSTNNASYIEELVSLPNAIKLKHREILLLNTTIASTINSFEEDARKQYLSIVDNFMKNVVAKNESFKRSPQGITDQSKEKIRTLKTEKQNLCSQLDEIKAEQRQSAIPISTLQLLGLEKDKLIKEINNHHYILKLCEERANRTHQDISNLQHQEISREILLKGVMQQ